MCSIKNSAEVMVPMVPMVHTVPCEHSLVKHLRLEQQNSWFVCFLFFFLPLIKPLKNLV